mgnify:CR=1 FL=1
MGHFVERWILYKQWWIQRCNLKCRLEIILESDKSPSEISKNAPEINIWVKFEPKYSSNSSKWSSFQELSELLSGALLWSLDQEIFETLGHLFENQSFDGYL